jgi:hypothetical protein
MPIIAGRVYKVGQIGTFLRIPLGYVHLFGIVTQAGVEAMPEAWRSESASGQRWLTLVLVGERIGARFERGVGQYPTTGDEVHLVTNDDLGIIYNYGTTIRSVTIGHISSSESLPAKLNLNKLLTRHTALLGSTGSGKSNAVTVLLEAIAEGGFASSRVLLIDPHGEYASALGEHSRVFRIGAESGQTEQPLHIPFWALPCQELLHTFVGTLSDAQEQYVRDKIVEKRTAARSYLAEPPEAAMISADSPVPFSLKALWYELDRFERTTFKQDRKTECLLQEGDAEELVSARFELHSTTNSEPYVNNQAKGLAKYLAQLRNRLLDPRFQFLYREG